MGLEECKGPVHTARRERLQFESGITHRSTGWANLAVGDFFSGHVNMSDVGVRVVSRWLPILF